MAIIITPAEVNEICPNAFPTAVIDDLICMVQDRIGDCVETSYAECTGRTILKYAVCHFVESMQGGETSSKRAANGASVNYTNMGAGEGLSSTPSGRLLIQLDTAGCTSNLVNDTFLFTTVGSANKPNGDC